MTASASLATEWEIWLAAIARTTSRRDREALIADAARGFGCPESTVKRKAAAFKRRSSNTAH